MKKAVTMLLCLLLVAGICACSNDKLTVQDIPDEFFGGIKPGETKAEVMNRFPDAEEGTLDGADVISVTVYEDELIRLSHIAALDADGLIANSQTRYALKKAEDDFSEDEITAYVNGTKKKILSELTAMYGEGTALDDDDKSYKWENAGNVYYLLCLPANEQTEVYASFMLQCGPAE